MIEIVIKDRMNLSKTGG